MIKYKIDILHKYPYFLTNFALFIKKKFPLKILHKFCNFDIKTIKECKYPFLITNLALLYKQYFL